MGEQGGECEVIVGCAFVFTSCALMSVGMVRRVHLTHCICVFVFDAASGAITWVLKEHGTLRMR